MSNQDCDKFRVSDKHNNMKLFLCGFNRAIQNYPVLRDGETYQNLQMPSKSEENGLGGGQTIFS